MRGLRGESGEKYTEGREILNWEVTFATTPCDAINK